MCLKYFGCTSQTLFTCVCFHRAPYIQTCRSALGLQTPSPSSSTGPTSLRQLCAAPALTSAASVIFPAHTTGDPTGKLHQASLTLADVIHLQHFFFSLPCAGFITKQQTPTVNSLNSVNSAQIFQEITCQTLRYQSLELEQPDFFFFFLWVLQLIIEMGFYDAHAIMIMEGELTIPSLRFLPVSQ